MISDESNRRFPSDHSSFDEPLRRGLLIDVDCALEVDNIGYWVGFVVSRIVF
jgi:hypothetical protein